MATPSMMENIYDDSRRSVGQATRARVRVGGPGTGINLPIENLLGWGGSPIETSYRVRITIIGR